jgi:hypothetical protein
LTEPLICCQPPVAFFTFSTLNFSTPWCAPVASANSAIMMTVPLSAGTSRTLTHADASIASPGATSMAAALRT